MLASEVIKRYEAYCPQELSMEGDVRGLQVGTLQKDIHKVMGGLRYPRADGGGSYRSWGGLDHRQARAYFPSYQGLVADRGPKSDLYRFDQA